jgi:hypothetical protein
MVDAIEAQIAPLERELRRLARRQTGCRALMRLYGMGEADLAGHALRARRRHPPVGVAQGGADGRHRHRRAPLRPPQPRRQADPTGLAAAALGALRGRPVGVPPEQPDHGDYLALKARGLSHTRASLTFARKLAAAPTTSCASSGPTPSSRSRPLIAHHDDAPSRPAIVDDHHASHKDRAAAVTPPD